MRADQAVPYGQVMRRWRRCAKPGSRRWGSSPSRRPSVALTHATRPMPHGLAAPSATPASRADGRRLGRAARALARSCWSWVARRCVARTRRCRSTAYTVELTDPSALGGRLAPRPPDLPIGAAAGACPVAPAAGEAGEPAPKAEPVAKAEPKIEPPKPEPDAPEPPKAAEPREAEAAEAASRAPAKPEGARAAEAEEPAVKLPSPETPPTPKPEPKPEPKPPAAKPTGAEAAAEARQRAQPEARQPKAQKPERAEGGVRPSAEPSRSPARREA